MAAAECGHVDILERLLTNEPAARINATNKVCIHVNARVFQVALLGAECIWAEHFILYVCKTEWRHCACDCLLKQPTRMRTMPLVQ